MQFRHTPRTNKGPARYTAGDTTMDKKKTINRVASIARKAIAVGGDMAGVVVHLRGDTTPLGVAVAAVKAADSLLKLHRPPGLLDGWRTLPLGHAKALVIRSMEASRLPRVVPAVRFSTADSTCWEFSCGAATCRWNAGGDWTSDVYLPDGADPKQLTEILAEVVWKENGEQLLFRPGTFRDPPNLEPDLVSGARESATASEIWSRMEPLHAAGISVSALLHGPPGTGKSCIARRIVQLAGGRSMRVSAGDIGYSDKFSSVVDFMKPSAIVIDDMDRGTSAVLEHFDELRARCMVLASMNATDQIDSALLRPGRFDEVVLVERLDAGAMDGLLKGVPPDDAVRLRKLPVAYTARYLQLREHVGADVATEQLSGLESRHSLVMSRTEPKETMPA